MKKKLIPLILVLVCTIACAFGLAACVRIPENIIYLEDTNHSAVTYISFFGFKNDERDLIAFENSLHGFMADNPDINVSYEGLKNDDKLAENYYKMLDMRYKSNCLDEVLMLKKEKITEFCANGDLEDISGDIDLSVFNSLVRSQIKNNDGSIYFVPLALTSYCMYVNYDVVYDYCNEVPKNIDEFRAACDNFIKKQKEKGGTLAPIICNNNRSLRTIAEGYGLYDLYQQPDSAQIIDGYNTNPQPLLDTYLKKGVDLVYDFIQRGYIDAQKTAKTAQTTVAEGGDMYEFMKGEQPFMITGSWATSRITATEEGKNMNYGVHPLPLLSAAEGGRVIVMDIDLCTSVNAKAPAKKLAAAKRFISYFSKPESVWEYCNNNNSYSPLANETRIPDNKTLAPHIPYFTNGKSVLGTNYRMNFDCAGSLKKALALLLQGHTADEAFNNLQQSIMKEVSGK